MTMGLILLGIITISLFFPFGRRAFGGMRITAPWAFLIVACFAVGVIVPVVTIGSTFTMSLSGFLFPALIMLALVPRADNKKRSSSRSRRRTRRNRGSNAVFRRRPGNDYGVADALGDRVRNLRRRARVSCRPNPASRRIRRVRRNSSR